MKKLVLAALAIGAMAACTKSNVQYEQPGEISLQPVTQKATKAAVTGPDYPTEEAYNFNVWAWWGKDKENKKIVDYRGYRTYIEKGTFTHRGENVWGGSPAYYWPTTGYLVFAGYSPFDATGTFDYNLKSIYPQLTISDYKQIEGVDLMWFDVTDYSYDQTTAQVPANFKHALSWLDFKMKLKDGSPSNWVITKVELKDIHTEGNATIDKGSNPVWNTNGVYSTLTLFSSSPYTVGSVNHPVIDALVIPQSVTSVHITYNLKGTGNNVLEDQTVTLPLTAGTTDDTTWNPGKHYVYTITFGANEIFISPTVATWGEEIEITIE